MHALDFIDRRHAIDRKSQLGVLKGRALALAMNVSDCRKIIFNIMEWGIYAYKQFFNVYLLFEMHAQLIDHNRYLA